MFIFVESLDSSQICTATGKALGRPKGTADSTHIYFKAGTRKLAAREIDHHKKNKLCLCYGDKEHGECTVNLGCIDPKYVKEVQESSVNVIYCSGKTQFTKFELHQMYSHW